MEDTQELEDQHPESADDRPFRRWPFIVSIVILGIIAAGLGAVFAYSADSAQQWRNAANNSAQELTAMTKQRDDLKAQFGEQKKQLDDMTSRYATATDRIRSLSNEKAQVGDDVASLATTAASLSSLVAMSKNVTKEMDGCIKDLQKLQSYLINSSAYDTSSLVSYARQINSGCDQARADSAALSAKLAG